MNTIKEYKLRESGVPCFADLKGSVKSKEEWLSLGFNPDIITSWFEEVKPKEPERIGVEQLEEPGRLQIYKGNKYHRITEDQVISIELLLNSI